MELELRETSQTPSTAPNIQSHMTFRDVLYTSIIGPQTTSQWDTANVTVIEVLALGPENVMKSHWGVGVYPIPNSAGGVMIHLCTDLWRIHGDEKLGIITFQQKQVTTAETVQYHLIKFHNKKDYRRLVKTLSEIRTYFYTSFQV